jgi:hypothetical protein
MELKLKQALRRGYWDKYMQGGRWNIMTFNSATTYAWCPFNNKPFEWKIKFFAAIQDFNLPNE